MVRRHTLWAAGLVLAAFAIAGCEQRKLQVLNPRVRAVPPGQENTSAYLTVQNRGPESDAIVSASTPAARTVELHHMQLGGEKGNVMKMRPVEEIGIPAMGDRILKPGDYHLMLIGLTKPLTAGDTIDLELTFEKAGKRSVRAEVVEIETEETEEGA